MRNITSHTTDIKDRDKKADKAKKIKVPIQINSIENILLICNELRTRSEAMATSEKVERQD